jgi:hypothetical protein
MVQIVDVSALHLQTVTLKISTLPLPAKLVCNSFDESSPLPIKSFPGLSPLFFPSLSHFFLFYLSLLKSIKESNLKKKLFN